MLLSFSYSLDRPSMSGFFWVGSITGSRSPPPPCPGNSSAPLGLVGLGKAEQWGWGRWGRSRPGALLHSQSLPEFAPWRGWKSSCGRPEESDTLPDRRRRRSRWAQWSTCASPHHWNLHTEDGGGICCGKDVSVLQHDLRFVSPFHFRSNPSFLYHAPNLALYTLFFCPSPRLGLYCGPCCCSWSSLFSLFSPSSSGHHLVSSYHVWLRALLAHHDCKSPRGVSPGPSCARPDPRTCILSGVPLCVSPPPPHLQQRRCSGQQVRWWCSQVWPPGGSPGCQSQQGPSGGALCLG